MKLKCYAQRVGLDPFRPVVKVDIVILSRLLARET